MDSLDSQMGEIIVVHRIFWSQFSSDSPSESRGITDERSNKMMSHDEIRHHHLCTLSGTGKAKEESPSNKYKCALICDYIKKMKRKICLSTYHQGP